MSHQPVERLRAEQCPAIQTTGAHVEGVWSHEVGHQALEKRCAACGALLSGEDEHEIK